jgi:hypothetical protein
LTPFNSESLNSGAVRLEPGRRAESQSLTNLGSSTSWGLRSLRNLGRSWATQAMEFLRTRTSVSWSLLWRRVSSWARRAPFYTAFLGIICSEVCFGLENSETYTRPNKPDEWVWKFQSLAAAIVGLLGASAAVLAVWLSNRLSRANENTREVTRRTELAGNLISLIEAEKQFSEKGYYPLDICNIAYEVPDITPEEIVQWINLEGPLNLGTTAELVRFWGGIYEQLKGFPSPICDIVSFVLWASGRAAFLMAGARQRGKDLSPTDLRQAAIRIHHLLTAIGLAASDIQTELLHYIQSPRRYSRAPGRMFGRRSRDAYYEVTRVIGQIPGGPVITAFEVKQALSRKYLDQATKVAENKRSSTGQRSALLSARALPEDRSPQLLRLVLPASVIADLEHAVCLFKLHSDLDSEKEVGYVEFFEQMLECQKKSRQKTEPT